MNSTFKYNLIGFSILLGVSFFLISVTNRYILTINFFNNSGDPISGIPSQGAYIYDAMQKWIYLVTAAYLLVKIAIITLVLYTALYLADYQSDYSRIFNIVVFAEYIFLIPAILKVFWFRYEYPDGTLLDWHKCYILSALYLFPAAPADWYYPLQTLNIFEFSYWFLLGYGISKITPLDFDGSLRIVIFSYVPFLVVLVATVSFFTIMMFPNQG